MSERPYTINLDLCTYCKRSNVTGLDPIYDDGVLDGLEGVNRSNTSKIPYCDTLLDVYQQGQEVGRKQRDG